MAEQSQKVCPVVLRDQDGVVEILVVRHPIMGMQVLSGTVGAEEAPESAAVRTLAAKAGIVDARVVKTLDESDTIADTQMWHFIVCIADDLPDHWEFTPENEDGEETAFHWQPLEMVPNPDGHPVYLRALAHIRRVAIG